MGSRLPLNATPESNVMLKCGETPMFHGRMGRKGHRIAIQIMDPVKGGDEEA